MPKLSDTKIRAARARTRPYKLFDTEGLFLLITPTGRRWWRQRYRFAGQEKLLGLGTYPEVGLGQAREESLVIRRQIAKGIDPSQQRKEKAAEELRSRNNTFKAVVTEWHATFSRQWSAAHAARILQRLEDNVFPLIGNKPFKDVTGEDVLTCLDRMINRGAVDTARRVLQILKKAYKWAIGRGLVDRSPVAHIEPKDHLPSVDVRHRAAIRDPQVFGALLRGIHAYHGGFVVACALKVLALTFVRPGELRLAQWPEFQLEGSSPTWRIPAERMKMGGADHLVPLSKQAVQALQDLQPLTEADGRGYVFPSVRNASRPMSENTLNAALRTMGFTKQQHTAHGFRGTASTLLNEREWNKDAIELQLSHMPRDKTRASYNSADHLALRRVMMQAWADYLDDWRLKREGVNAPRVPETVSGLHGSRAA